MGDDPQAQGLGAEILVAIAIPAILYPFCRQVWQAIVSR
jgi:preprotein translocase subunit SecB